MFHHPELKNKNFDCILDCNQEKIFLNPDDVAEFSVEFVRNDQGLVYLPKLMVEIKLSASTGDARRLIDGGGVKINGEALAPKSYNVDPDLLDHAILQAGKRRFAKLV